MTTSERIRFLRSKLTLVLDESEPLGFVYFVSHTSDLPDAKRVWHYLPQADKDEWELQALEFLTQVQPQPHTLPLSAREKPSGLNDYA